MIFIIHQPMQNKFVFYKNKNLSNQYFSPSSLKTIMNPSYDQLNDYTHYLQSQVQKFTAFMLTQRKLNEQHLLIQNSVYEIVQKLNKFQDKLKIIEVNEKDNLLEMRKIRAEKQALRLMERRIQNVQHEISSLLKSEAENIELEESSVDYGERQRQRQFSSAAKKQSIAKNEIQSENLLNEFHMEEIERYLSEVFMDKEEAQDMISKIKDEIDFKIKKLQVEIDKSKQSFLKLTSNVNNLSNLNYLQGLNKRESKGENRLQTQSTKDMRIEPINQENTITKKQLRKMQKKLENFFTEKFSQINKAQNHQSDGSSVYNDKSLKFKKIQQKYDRLTIQQPKHPQSQRKIQFKDPHYSSEKRISLFDNQILRQRHQMQNRQDNNKKKQKSKSKNSIDSPIALLESQKNFKVTRNTKESPSQSKKFNKKKSLERMKKFNVDYMMAQ